MRYKKLIILVIFLVSLLTVSAASAADNTTSDVINVEEATDEVVNVENNQVILGENNNVGTFTDLANEIATATGELNLTKDYCYSNDYSYKNGITIDKKITINGNGFTIDGNILAKSFKVTSNNVFLININFINNVGERGASVYWEGDNGSLINCSFFNNVATTYSGGAVYWEGLNGSLVNCSFFKNEANTGGGAVSWSGVNGFLANCQFTNNNAGDYYGGGAVYWATNGNNGILVNCTFVNNTANDGKSVYWNGKNGILLGCNFINSNSISSSSSSSSYGGAVYWNGINGNLSNCNFINSSSSSRSSSSYSYSYGGAVYWYGSSGTLSNCNFINSSSNSRSSSSSSYSRGGAVYWYGSSGTLSNCNFINSSSSSRSSSSSSYSYGGAVYWYGSSGTLSNCNFINSSSSSSSSYSYSSSSSYGGAVYWYGSNGNLVNPTFKGNTAKSGPDWSGAQTLNILNNILPSVLTAPTIVTTTFGASEKLIVTLKDASDKLLIDEQISILLNNVEYTLETDYKGQVSFDIPKLTPKTYTATISYAGCKNCNPTNTTTKIKINKANTIINAQNISVSYKDPNGKLVATITNQYGNPLPVNLNLNFNENTTTIKADKKGQITIPTDTLCPGTYTATITYAGNVNYKSTTTTANIQINKANTIITAPDITAVYKDNTGKLVATLTNEYGKALSVYVNVNLNGTSYDVRTNSKGQISISTEDLALGSYTAIISYNGNGNYNPYTATANIVVEKPSPIISIIANDIMYGEDAQINVNLANDVPGNVHITVNGKTKRVPITNGEAAYTVSGLNGGIYDVSVYYAGNYKYKSVNITTLLNVNRFKPFISVSSATVTYGQNANIIAKFASDVTGNVKFEIDGVTKNAQITNGVAKYTFSGLKYGTHTVKVTYAGNYKYAPDSKVTTIKVNKNPAPIVSAATKNIIYGNDAVITVKLAQNVSGNIQITVQGMTQKIQINNNAATATFSGLNAGKHDVKIRYAGSTNYDSQIFSISFNISKINPISEVYPVSNIDYGEEQDIYVDLANNVVGNLHFYINGIDYKVPINNNYVSLNLPNLKAGNYNVKIYYAGSNNFNTQSINKSFSIAKINPITYVYPISNIIYGKEQNIRVDLADNVVGNLHFYINGIDYKVPINNDYASLNLPNLKAGNYNVKIYYAGSNNFNTQSINKSFSIAKINPITYAYPTSNIIYGEEQNIRVYLANNVPGNIHFVINGVDHKVQINGNYVNLNLPNIKAGNYDVRIYYAGSANFNAQSFDRSFNVSKIDPIINIYPISNIVYGEEQNIRVDLANNVVGNIHFVINGVDHKIPINDTYINLNLSNIKAGNYNIRIYYAGSANFNAQSFDRSFNVSKIDTITYVSPVSNIIYGEEQNIRVYLADNVPGNIHFVINGVDHKIPINDTYINLNLPNIKAGHYDVRIYYAGSTNFNAQSFDRSFTVSKIDPIINIYPISNIVYGEEQNIRVDLANNVPGNIHFIINNVDRTIKINGNYTSLCLPDLNAGSYNVEIRYDGNANYNSVYYTTSFIVFKADAITSLVAYDIFTDEYTEIIARLHDKATGSVRFILNEEAYDVPIIDHKAVLKIAGLRSDVYSVNALYGPTVNFYSQVVLTSFRVLKVGPGIDILVNLKGRDVAITGILPSDATGNAYISIDGKTYSCKVVSGIASTAIPDLKSGTYKISIWYPGDDKYGDATITRTFTFTTDYEIIYPPSPDYDTIITIAPEYEKYVGVHVGDYTVQTTIWNSTSKNVAGIWLYENGWAVDKDMYSTRLHYYKNGEEHWSQWGQGTEDAIYHKYFLDKDVIVDKVQIKFLNL